MKESFRMKKLIRSFSLLGRQEGRIEFDAGPCSHFDHLDGAFGTDSILQGPFFLKIGRVNLHDGWLG